ncbi:uncharacterized protein PpBr36_09246 [Pyricularia pennisetigena]|nr:uncharacterized protein PpBr36_09246 [Pyricularia pennisetigena]TLS21819.1 hypothetical protein PpBr36_09246 [Pyricularia pennisetigena]
MGCGTQNAPINSIDSPAWPGPPKKCGRQPNSQQLLGLPSLD